MSGMREDLCDYYGDSELLFADGYDNAVVGVSIGCNGGQVVYDTSKMVGICVHDMGMSVEEAWEWLEYNTFGAYVGERTPIYIDTDWNKSDETL